MFFGENFSNEYHYRDKCLGIPLHVPEEAKLKGWKLRAWRFQGKLSKKIKTYLLK